MMEFYRELEGGDGPVFLKLNHLADETISTIETILHTNERPSRGRFHEGRGTDYRKQMVEMHISEIGLCSGHSASGVWVNEHAETTVRGLHAAGDLACVPHNYMLGAFVYGKIAGESAADYCAGNALADIDEAQVEAESRVCGADITRRTAFRRHRSNTNCAAWSTTTCSRRKSRARWKSAWPGLRKSAQISIGYRHAIPHELMRAMEVHAIRDCAEMAARASLYRTESRWGLYHNRVDYPDRNDLEWFAPRAGEKNQWRNDLLQKSNRALHHSSGRTGNRCVPADCASINPAIRKGTYMPFNE